jgi:hypothetical protein
VLKVLGGAGAIGLSYLDGRWLIARLAAASRAGDGPQLASFAVADAPPATLSPSLVVNLFRREDLMNVSFSFYRVALDRHGPTPVLIPTGRPAWVIAQFPFQSIAEFDDLVDGTPASYPPTPCDVLASGNSQLAFQFPQAKIPFTAAGILDWRNWKPLLPAPAANSGNAPAADPTGLPTPSSPPLTYIEMAWHLFVAPGPTDHWVSAAEPIADGPWTELWQARLGNSSGPLAPDQDVYAVWTTGFDSKDPNSTDPFQNSLSDTNQANSYRLQLVELSSKFGPNQTPGSPAIAKTCMLTSLGATVDMKASYNQPAVSSIVSWTHKMSIGRDTFVRIVKAGWMFPFGNRGVYIETTTREFHVSPNGDTVAYLIERKTVEITQPVVVYPYPDSGAAPEPNDGRQNPWASIEFKTKVTPTIDQPHSPGNPGAPGTDISGVSSETAQWVNVGGAPFPFSIVGTDKAGSTFDFSASCIWVDEQAVKLDVDNVNTAYGSAPTPAPPALPWNECNLEGALLAFAPPPANGQPANGLGKSALHTDTVTHTSKGDLTNPSVTSPPWYPLLSSAQVHVAAVAQLTGAAGDGSSVPQVAYNTIYLTNGFGTPEVFLDFIANGPNLDFSQTGGAAASGTSLSGGIAAPNIAIDGFARDLGPIADTADLVKGGFDPATFFGALDAKILGIVPLAKILPTITAGPVNGEGRPDSPTAGSLAPTITSVPVYPDGAGMPPTKPPIAIKTTIDWSPTIQSFEAFQPKDLANGLSVHVQIYAPLDGSPPTTTVDGQLSDFDLALFTPGVECIGIHFNNVHFSSRTGAKANVAVDVGAITFLDQLKFIQDFEQLLTTLGGSSIDVEPSGITATFTLSIPNVGVGVFALENLSFGAEIDVPFTGDPVAVGLHLCTRDNPFLLSIMIFTGGGWFGIRFDANGLEMVEVGLEFGASCSIDLGVASGGVSIMVGIYFQYQVTSGNSTVALTGFFKASGNLEVLGIVSISITFYLGLTYQDPPGDAYGTATVTVTVSVLCFSQSVSMTVTKQISTSDPTISFSDAISATDWQQYCATFA